MAVAGRKTRRWRISVTNPPLSLRIGHAPQRFYPIAHERLSPLSTRVASNSSHWQVSCLLALGIAGCEEAFEFNYA